MSGTCISHKCWENQHFPAPNISGESWRSRFSQFPLISGSFSCWILTSSILLCLFSPSCFQCGYQHLTSGSPQHTGCHVWQACYTKGVEKLRCHTARKMTDKATLEVFVLKQSPLELTSETFSRVLSPLHSPGCCPVSSHTHTHPFLL